MAEDKHIVFSYGRMNPPTAGHSKVVDKVKSHADKIGANHAVVVSHSQNNKTDPLHHEHKKEYLRHIHPDVNFEHSTKDHPHFLAQLKKFNHEGHTHATMVVGSDRVKQFKSLAHKYNGKEYNYKKIHVLSAGQRDPDAEGVAGISGTKMRAHASGNDFKSFKSGLHPNHSDEHAKKLYKATRDRSSAASDVYKRQGRGRHVRFSKVFIKRRHGRNVPEVWRQKKYRKWCWYDGSRSSQV